MPLFYFELTSTFVIPLLTRYFMWRFTRVHRQNGIVGLLVGAAYVTVRLMAPFCAEQFGIAALPRIMVDCFAAYLWSILIAAGTMLIASLVLC